MNTNSKAIAADIVRELRENPKAWTQGAVARLPNGDEAFIDERAACCWCLVGHVIRRNGDVVAFRSAAGIRQRLSDYNDDANRTIEDIIILCEKVAAS